MASELGKYLYVWREGLPAVSEIWRKEMALKSPEDLFEDCWSFTLRMFNSPDGPGLARKQYSGAILSYWVEEFSRYLNTVGTNSSASNNWVESRFRPEGLDHDFVKEMRVEVGESSVTLYTRSSDWVCKAVMPKNLADPNAEVSIEGEVIQNNGARYGRARMVGYSITMTPSLVNKLERVFVADDNGKKARWTISFDR